MKKLRNLLLISSASVVTLLPVISSSCDDINQGPDQELIEKIKKLEQDNQAVQAALNAKISELETNKKAYDLELAQKDNQIKQHQNNIAQLNDELTTLKHQNETKSTELNNQINLLLDKIDGINDIKASYENQIIEAKEQLEELKAQLHSNQDEIDKLSKSIEVKQAYITELEGNISGLKYQIAQLQAQIELNKQTFAKKEAEIAKNEQSILNLNNEKLILNQQIGELKNEKIKLLKEHENEINEKNKKISALDSLLLGINKQSVNYVNAKNLLAIYQTNAPLQAECASEFIALKKAIDAINNEYSIDKTNTLIASYSNALTSAIGIYSDAIAKLNIINSELESPTIALPTDKFDNLIEYLKELIYLINRNKVQIIEQYNRKLESYAKAFNMISNYRVTYSPIVNNDQLNLPNLISQASDELKFNIWSYIALNISLCDQMNAVSLDPIIKRNYQNFRNELTKRSYINLSFDYLLSSFQALLKVKKDLTDASANARNEAEQNKASVLKAIKDFETQNNDLINYINELASYKELEKLREEIGNEKLNYDSIIVLCARARSKLKQVENDLASVKKYYNSLKQETEQSISKFKQLQAEIDKWVNASDYYKQNAEIRAMLAQITTGLVSLETIDWKGQELDNINSKIEASNKAKDNIKQLWDKFEANMNAPRNADEISEFYKNNAATVKKLIIENKATKNPSFSYYNIYDSIFKRTFKIVFNNVDDAKKNESTLTFGTAWLLDYVALGNNKYRLYLGTNLHVANANIDKNDHSDNRQESKISKGVHTVSSFIGFDPDWADGKNQYYMYQFMNNWDSHALYIPKNFYVAINFISPNKVKGNIAADFAVLEWYVDLNAFAKWRPMNFLETAQFYNPEARNEYKKLIETGSLQRAYVQHILDAIAQVNASKAAIANKAKANFNSSLPYISVDYMSVGNILKEYNKMYPDNKIINYLSQPESYKSAIYLDSYMNTKFGNNKFDKQPNNVFIAGYPAKNGNKTEINGTWSKINENGDSIYNYNVTDSIADYSVEFNPKSTINYDGTSYQRYMLQFYSSSANNLSGGSSGSLAVNQDNLPIGLKWGSVVNGETKYFDNNSRQVHSYRDVVASFVNTFDKPFYWKNDTADILYAYNLIDGTNKDNYPYQVSSYREELIKRYGPEYKTVLFDK
ncbi:MIP family Ig-specific serine endopeptidase [Mycoplasma aquilae ATCC BAA-1896]|uniref:MIP family Ig-specific serine endopeptidase n=1 Tax=Mycoplasma aquilae TaxID=1312741 RepID=UPI003A853D15